MKYFLALLLIMGFSATQASESQTLTFNGQPADSLTLETIDTITRYREEDRDTTCTRKVPYETEECGYETRYRQECRWQDGRNVCRTEYERVCRTVTRYRRECRQGEPRRVCRQTDPTRICRNGRCRTEPGRTVCDYKPGRQVCTQVPYQDRECTREPRRVCNWEPGRNVCSQVPYQEWVCRTVTRYRDEQYACRRTVRIPYNFDRKVKANININYNDPTQQGLVDFILTLDKGGQVSVKGNDRSDKPVLIGMSKVSNTDLSEDETLTTVGLEFNLYDKETELAPVKENIRSAGLTRTGAWFTMGRITNPDRVRVGVTITRKTILGNTRTPFNKILSANELNLTRNGDGTKVLIDLSKYGVSLDDKKWTMKVDVNLTFEDNIINRTRETLSRSGQFEIRVD